MGYGGCDYAVLSLSRSVGRSNYLKMFPSIWAQCKGSVDCGYSADRADLKNIKFGQYEASAQCKIDYPARLNHYEIFTNLGMSGRSIMAC